MKWKDLEQVIAAIAASVAPSAVTRHDHHVRGKSGIVRKLDVTISADLGLCRVLVAVECKHRKHRIDIGEVAKFQSMLDDVGATSGVMISTSGFTRGATNLAGKSRIQLFLYRKAGVPDRVSMFGENARFYFSVDEFEVTETVVHIDNEPETVLLPIELDQRVVDAQGAQGTIREFRNTAIQNLPRGIPVLGRISLAFRPEPALFLDEGDRLLRVMGVEVRGTKRAKMYTAEIEADGHVLSSPEDGVVRLRQLEHGFDWRSVCDSQQGRELTLEEYLNLGTSPTFSSEVSESDGKVSIRVTERTLQ